MRGLNRPDPSARPDPSDRYATAVSIIDSANAEDPNQVTVRGERRPLALAHGQLAAEWVARLVPDADEALLLAARAHHLRRWEVPRSSYPEGRAGYLRWRRDQKDRHAEQVADLLGTAGYDEATIHRVQTLVRRQRLDNESGTQTVEDAACLVFLETQLVEVSGQLERDHLIEVITKTANKMSPAALGLVDEVPLGDEARQILADALG
ncbi:MAG: DUF4202 domain-containing protein [Acidimicrobiales bacterium]|nr:DUF4202 domain-containing protein [Acidimicrobiales bacterium]